MRFMMLMIPRPMDEADWSPDPEAVAAMGAYNDQLTKAGVLLALDGLQPPSTGARVSFAGGRPKVVDGPFAEAKEVIAGFFLIVFVVPFIFFGGFLLFLRQFSPSHLPTPDQFSSPSPFSSPSHLPTPGRPPTP